MTTRIPLVDSTMERSSLTRFAWLSIGAAVATIVLKGMASYLTGSVGLLSDAIESLANLVAAIMALAMLVIAARPPDDGHHFGHSKAEYFASGLEGLLIIVAAVGIGVAAWDRLQHPRPLESLNLGLAISSGAALINLGVAKVLLHVGRRYRSITLEADAKHLLTDVWTTAGVLVGLGTIALTGWQPFDPIIAFLVGLNILRTGFALVKRSVAGLLDATLPEDENARIDRVLDSYRELGVEFHELRTRQSGAQRFMTVHVLVPGRLSVQAGHELVDRIEADIREAVGPISIVAHLEPLEDLASFVHGQPDRPAEVGRLNLGRAAARSHGHAGRRVRSKQNPPVGVQPMANARDSRRRAVWCSRVGLVLIVAGTAASMLLEGWSANVAMGAALIGLIAVLSCRPNRPQTQRRGG